MEVTVHPRTLLERLRLAGALTGKRYPAPVLETVQFEVTDDRRAWLRASDGWADIELVAPVLQVIRPGVVQLPRNPVVRALSGGQASSVTIREEPAETLPIASDPKTPSRQVSVVSPQGTVTLPTFDPVHFPRRPLEESEQAVRLTAWRFARLIGRTAFAADEQSSRWALGGCFLGFEGGELHAVATDGRAIAHAFEPARGSGLSAPPTTSVGGEERPLAPVVPLQPVRALVAALALVENAELEVAFTASGRFQARTGGLSVSARLPEGRFPAWKEVFPESATRGCRIDDPSRLARALKDILRFTTRGARATELRLTGHRLALAVQNDLATARVELTVRNLAAGREDAVSTIDPEYLLRFLDGSGRPFDLWYPPADGTPLVCRGEAHRYALMPMDRAEAGPPSVAKEPPADRPREGPPAEEAETRSA